jgi:hypothetical protein
VMKETENKIGQQMIDECISVLHSLRMLSLHVVKCITEWRKQLIYSYLITTSGPHSSFMPERNSINKFKNLPFVWEGDNYLLKMKSDTQFLA